MTNNDLTNLYQILSNSKGKGNVKFAYFVAKNLQKLASDIEVLKEVVKPSESFNTYMKERIELLLKYCNKDENGSPVMINTDEVTISGENKDLFDIDNITLKEKYKEAIDEQKVKEDGLNNLLQENIDITLFKVSLEDIPNELAGIVEYLVEYDLIKET